MKIIKKYNQFRRDCWCDLECENCGEKETYKNAYDDDNFWKNVVPNEFKCKKCGKTTHGLGLEPQAIQTRYGQDEIV